MYRITFSNIRISTVFENYGADAQYSGNDLWLDTNLTLPNTLPDTTDPNRTVTLSTKKFSPPTSITIAVSTDIIGENSLLQIEDSIVTLHTALIKSNDAFEKGSFGMEFVYSGLKNFQFALRGGTQMSRADDWETIYTCGAGLVYNPSEDYGIGLDYAYRNNELLDQSHYFSLNLNF